jgi:hypothetical protein
MMTLQKMAVALALLLPCAAQAQSSDPRKDEGVCNTVAQTVLAADPSGGWRGPWQQPLDALTKSSAGAVGIDTERGPSETKAAALDRLRQEYRAEPNLLEAVGNLTEGRFGVFLHRFGMSSLRLAEVVMGTASCQHFVFFDAPSAGAARAILAPPVAQTNDETAFCFKRTGYAGEIAGVPVFIVQQDKDSMVELSITPWRDGGWQRQCHIVIRFSDVFEATDRFCKDVDCNAMADQALSLTRKVDQRSQAAQEDANEQDKNFKALMKLADDQPLDIQLPTFGGQIHGLFGGAYSEFAPDSVLLPVVVGGEIYLGRVGHAAFAWRTVPDYLFAAYKRVGDSLEPVAGFYISKTRGKPISATVN